MISGLSPKEQSAVKDNNKKWLVYILRCVDDSLYVGATNDIERRFVEHLTGKGSKFTRSRKAAEIIYTEEFNNKYDAFKREKEIKGFSRHKKLNLIKLKTTIDAPL